MFTVTAPVGQRSAQGPQYQHSSTCMYALPVSGSIASASSGHTSTQRLQPSMHSDWSTETGTSTRMSTNGGGVAAASLQPAQLEATGAGQCLLQAARETEFQPLTQPLHFSVPLRARAAAK